MLKRSVVIFLCGSVVLLMAMTWGATQTSLADGRAQEETAKKPAAKAAPKPDAHISTPDKIQWKAFAPGIETGPVYGDCDKAGSPCVFQVKFADGAMFPAHWHPMDENVTVLQGTFLAGMGDKYDEAKTAALPAGSYIFMPRRMHHFAAGKGETIVQVHGIAPFKVMWVKPAGGSAKAGAKAKS